MLRRKVTSSCSLAIFFQNKSCQVELPSEFFFFAKYLEESSNDVAGGLTPPSPAVHESLSYLLFHFLDLMS